MAQTKKLGIQVGGDAAGFNRAIGAATTKLNSFKAAAVGLGAGLAAGVGVLAFKSVSAAANFEKAMADVEAAADATEDEMALLESKAVELGKSSKFMMSDIAGAEKALAKSGYTANETVDAMDGVTNAAAASGEDLEQVGIKLTNVVKGFGASADETDRFADVFAEMARSSNVDINSLAEGMKYVGPLTSDMLEEMGMSAEEARNEFGSLEFRASDLGMSVERTAAMMGILGDAGIEAGQAGRQLRSAFLRYQKIQANLMTGTQADLFKKLAGNAFESSDAAKEWMSAVKSGKVTFTEFITTLREGGAQAGELSKLFGQNAVTAVVKLADSGDELDALTEKAKGSKGAAEEMAETKLDTLSGQMEVLKGSVDNLFQSLGERLLPKLQDLLQDVVIPMVNEMTDWVDEQGSLNEMWDSFLEKLGPADDLLRGLWKLMGKDWKGAGEEFLQMFKELDVKSGLGLSIGGIMAVKWIAGTTVVSALSSALGGAGAATGLGAFTISGGTLAMVGIPLAIGFSIGKIMEMTGATEAIQDWWRHNIGGSGDVEAAVEEAKEKWDMVGGEGYIPPEGKIMSAEKGKLQERFATTGFGQKWLASPGDVSDLKKYIEGLDLSQERQAEIIDDMLGTIAQNVDDQEKQTAQLETAIERLSEEFTNIDFSGLSPERYAEYQSGTPWTGAGPRGEVAGITHRQEAVLPRNVLRGGTGSILDYLGHSPGGVVMSGMSGQAEGKLNEIESNTASIVDTLVQILNQGSDVNIDISGVVSLEEIQAAITREWEGERRAIGRTGG